jgi:hypothetical protein
MNWLLAILAVIVTVLLFAAIRHVDTARAVQRELVEAREALQRCEATIRQPPPEALAPTPAPALEGGGRRTTAVDARPNGVDLGRKEERGREAAKRECEREAERLGKSATLWCAGL